MGAPPSSIRDAGRVLVTGANGHLGIRLLQRLATRGSDGLQARAVVRSRNAAEAVRAAVPAEAVEIRILDYQDVDAVADAATGCAHVVHLVGILKETAGARYADAHESAATSLARAAEKAGVRRIVYPSILGADPASPNPCLASKGRAERILLEETTGNTWEIATLRIFHCSILRFAGRSVSTCFRTSSAKFRVLKYLFRPS